ncbi:extracellular solute-binding protein [Thorsellia anophelis]
MLASANQVSNDNLISFKSLSILGIPKYSENTKHPDYVNPNAPKTGQLVLSSLGTFDNFNRFAQRGVAAERTGELYDTLFKQSLDDAASYYPLIAESISIHPNYQYAEITLNKNARFHDNSPITSEDVLFSFDKFKTEGVVQFAKKFEGVSLSIIDKNRFSVTLPTPDKSLLFDFINLTILPKHYWHDKKLNEPLITPPLGSGPYKVKDYKMGQYVVYERVKDYWAKDLFINTGMYNFDTIRYDYFLDGNVTLEAFKSGAFDVQYENRAKNWATAYHGENFDNGNILKVERKNNAAANTQWFAFNITSPLFEDRNIREAIALSFDFEWLNKMLFYNSYTRANSFFQNTKYAATGLPSSDELAILLPFKDILPKEVFGPAFKAPVTDSSGFNRENLIKALDILENSGWSLQNGKLINDESNKQFEFELLTYSGSPTSHLLQFQQALEKIGIIMTIRQVDVSQYVKRMQARDYDMIIKSYPAWVFPDSNLFYFWHSDYIDSTYNASGVANPAVDHLIEQIAEAQGDEARLMILSRALDRILTWQYYMFPQWYTANTRFAHWNKFGIPEIYPDYDIGVDTWWYEQSKAESLIK